MSADACFDYTGHGMNGAFSNRSEAGKMLAPRLREFAGRDDVIVLALPRGGVIVGAEVAGRLGVPMDVLIVRKLGVPGQEELAMGAIASGGIEFCDTAVIEALRISDEEIHAVVERERRELQRREKLYRQGRPPPRLNDKTVIVVDDGLATGATMRAAVRAVILEHPRAVVAAAPVASSEAAAALRREVAAVVTVITTPRLFSVGHYYRDFRPVTDDEVKAALAGCGRRDGKTDSRTFPYEQPPK